MNHHDNASIQNLLDILKAGINRFYSEGYIQWSKEALQRALGDEMDLEDPRIQSALHLWEETGFIRFLGQDKRYIEVLKPFPPSSSPTPSHRT